MKYDRQFYETKLREGKDSSHNLSKWVDKLDVLVYVANNEQTPWTGDMLGHDTEGMSTKKETGVAQVGDYHFYLRDYGMYAGVCGERKSVSDLYGTLTTGRKRFYREVDRFREDDRFDQFVIFVEGTEEDYFIYQPKYGKNGRFNKTAAAQIKKRVPYQVESKRANILSFLADGIGIRFSGSPENAAKDFADTCKYWCRHNYEKIIK